MLFPQGLKTHVDARTQAHMNKFRAERNFFVSGFTLFLCLVIKQVVNLISDNADLQVNHQYIQMMAILYEYI